MQAQNETPRFLCDTKIKQLAQGNQFADTNIWAIICPQKWSNYAWSYAGQLPHSNVKPYGAQNDPIRPQKRVHTCASECLWVYVVSVCKWMGHKSGNSWEFIVLHLLRLLLVQFSCICKFSLPIFLVGTKWNNPNNDRVKSFKCKRLLPISAVCYHKTSKNALVGCAWYVDTLYRE